MTSNFRSENLEAEESAFHRASKTGNIQIITCFLKAGVNPNLHSKRSDSPLYLACLANQLDAAELLLTKGADPNMKNSGGNTVLHSAALQGNLELGKLLIKHNASLNVRNERWQYPLHLAVKSNHASLVALFLDTENKAALLKDINGKTALEYCKNPECKSVFTRFINWRERRGILFVQKLTKSFKRLPSSAFREIAGFL